MQKQSETKSYFIYRRDIEYLLATLGILTPYDANRKIGEVYGETFIAELREKYALLFEFYDNLSKEYSTGIFEPMLEYDMNKFTLETYFQYMLDLPGEKFVSSFLGLKIEETRELLSSEKEQVLFYQRNREIFKSFFVVEVLFQKTDWLIKTYYEMAVSLRTEVAEKYLTENESYILPWEEKIMKGAAQEGPLQYSESIMGKSFRNRGPYLKFFFMPSLFIPMRCCRWFADNQILIFNVNKDDDLQSEQIAEGLKMMSDKTRYKILVLLKEKKSLSGIEIAEYMGLATSTVSHHMTQLKNSGLVHEETVGNTKYYSINEYGIKNCISVLEKTFL